MTTLGGLPFFPKGGFFVRPAAKVELTYQMWVDLTKATPIASPKIFVGLGLSWMKRNNNAIQIEPFRTSMQPDVYLLWPGRLNKTDLRNVIRSTTYFCPRRRLRTGVGKRCGRCARPRPGEWSWLFRAGRSLQKSKEIITKTSPEKKLGAWSDNNARNAKKSSLRQKSRPYSWNTYRYWRQRWTPMRRSWCG